jgi:hypothetical protein
MIKRNKKVNNYNNLNPEEICYSTWLYCRHRKKAQNIGWKYPDVYLLVADISICETSAPFYTCWVVFFYVE